MDIIKEFNKNDKMFQKEAVEYAKKNKDEVSDVLLSHLKDFVSNMDKNKNCPFSVVYAVFLLAEFKDKRLFKVIIDIFSKEGYDFYNLLGDWAYDNLSSIIVSVFDGDFDSINKVIENKNIDENIRGYFLKTYVYFCDNGLITKDVVEKYLLKLLDLYDYIDDEDDMDDIYTDIMEVIASLHLFSLMNEVKKMYYYGVINTMMIGDYDSFVDYIFNYDYKLVRIKPIDDTIKSMSWWACFDNREDVFDEDKVSKMFESFIEEETKANNMKDPSKVGRNDPCPCGSGKKYKKCCINKEINFLPYQSYITKSLDEYPKKKTSSDEYDLYDFYKEEYIEIDKLLYNVLKHKAIPMFINRDYLKENRINIDYLKEAFDKIKVVVKNNSFKTINDYDEKVSIHYSLYQFFERYSKLLMEMINKHIPKEKEYLVFLEELVDFFYDSFDLNDSNETLFLNVKDFLFNAKGKIDEGIEYFKEKLKTCDYSVKFDVYQMLIELYEEKDYDLACEKLEEYIDKETDNDLKEYLEEMLMDYREY